MLTIDLLPCGIRQSKFGNSLSFDSDKFYFDPFFLNIGNDLHVKAIIFYMKIYACIIKFNFHFQTTKDCYLPGI